MSRQRLTMLLGTLALIGAGQSSSAQCPGCMMGRGNGMMGMGRDSATRAQMVTVHEMLLGHDRITRTVVNLPDGIRTTTESDDPGMTKLIREHVREMYARVNAADDPGLPMESPALRTIYRNGDKIATLIDTTSKGIMIQQTSRDPVIAAALQKHASEVSDLARDGMVAMHRAMMANGGMMGRGMMRPTTP